MLMAHHKHHHIQSYYICFSCSYNTIKTYSQDGNSLVPLSPTAHLIIAAQAGTLSLAITNPIYVVKTRLCLQYNNGNLNSKQYAGMFDGLQQIYTKEGFRGLYRVSYRSQYVNII